MQIVRKQMLSLLNNLACATHKTEVLEQSHCFVFDNGEVIAFNGEIIARGLFEWDTPPFAVGSNDLIQVLNRIPDDDLDITIRQNQMVVKGKRKRAGLTIQNKVLLPYGDVPLCTKMAKAEVEMFNQMGMAARICSGSGDNIRTSHVHLTPTVIEATDSFRMLRINGEFPVKKEVLVPAGSVLSVGKFNLTHIKYLSGWLFLKDTTTKTLIGIRCTDSDYFESKKLDAILDMKDASRITLPEIMRDVVARAVVMSDDPTVHGSPGSVSIDSKSIRVRTEKDTGWYEEKQPCKYDGMDMTIQVDLSVFRDILAYTNEALITEDRIKMEKGGIEFLSSMIVPGSN